MKLLYKVFVVALTTALPIIAISANAQEVVTKTTTMSDGSEIVVTKTTDVNEAADSMVIKHTTFSYDANKNGIIENNEVNSYITRYADKNRDGYIDKNEGDSMMYFYNMMGEEKPKEEKSYTYWDKDKDNRLDSSEVETLVTNTGIYKKWDTNKDGKIDSGEFAVGTFKAYDDNGDGVINLEEWGDVTM